MSYPRRYLKPGDIAEESRQFCHFDTQRVIKEPTGHQLLWIDIECPGCGASSSTRVSAIRYFGRVPYCNTCCRRQYLKIENIRLDWRPYVDVKSQQPKNGNSGPTVVRVTCPRCQQERWMQLQSFTKMASKAPSDYLPYCTGCGREVVELQRERTRFIGGDGYVYIKVKYLNQNERDLIQSMLMYRSGGRRTSIQEHRLVMVKYLGRSLLPGEQVHHRNSDRTDNRLANLRLVTNTSHPQAPNDEIANLSVEIEALARELTSMQVDPLGILKQCLDTLVRMKPKVELSLQIQEVDHQARSQLELPLSH